MDIDRYVAEHRDEWDRLSALVAKAHPVRRLTADELDELLDRYERTSAHLAYVRTYLPDPALVARLTTLVAAAHGIVYAKRDRGWSAVGTFFSRTFPAAVWRLRWFVVISALLTFVPAVAMGVWVAHSDAAFRATAPAAVREAYLQEDFEAYYSSEPAAQFAAEVYTNNVRVAVLAFASGILGCVVTAWILVQNGALVGTVGGMFSAIGEPARFWGLILPHGLLELSCVIVAGAAGLRLGWTLIDPGDRRRAAALADEGRRCGAVVLGLVLALGVAGLIEGFVTGRVSSTFARVSIGVVAAGLFWTYVVVLGRSDGDEGRLGAADASLAAAR